MQGLMANPLITAMAEVASAHARLTAAQAASATRSMTEAQAVVLASALPMNVADFDRPLVMPVVAANASMDAASS